MALTYDLKSGLAAVKRSAMWAKLRVLSVFYQLDGSPAQRGA